MDDDTADPARAEPQAPHGQALRPEGKRPEARSKEIGGTAGPEPTRYGDWEHGGRCSDF